MLTDTHTSRSCVILLHGLNRTAGSLQKMARALEAEGYFVWNHSYPSRDKPIAELAKIAIEPALYREKAMAKFPWLVPA